MVIERVRRIWRSVPSELVGRRIRIVGIGAQFPAIIALLVIKPRRFRGEAIGRRCIAERAAVRAEGIVDAVRREGAPLPERIAAGFTVEPICAEIPEIFEGQG